MKHLSTLFVALVILFIASCKKASTATPAITTTTTTNPYYFRFTLNGTNDIFAVNFAQYMYLFSNTAGGYQSLNASLYPSVGIGFMWMKKDTVKESDIMGLAGQTFLYNDTVIQPELLYNPSDTATEWSTLDTANSFFSVKVISVTFLKNDTISITGTPIRTYVINGTCAGVLSNGTNTAVLNNGQFNIIISRDNY